MSDLIERQDAIDALFDWEMTYDWDEHCREEDPKPAYIVSPSDVIEHLPPAQPDPSACWACNCPKMQLLEKGTTQPEPVCINLNEPIKVKLTDWGKEIYYHQYDRTNQIAGREVCKPNFPKEDEDGYTEFQLWCFIELYGMHMGMTLPNVIEPLEIVYER